MRQGAEPIYLHVLRPLIKPYSAPLDAIFDVVASFGDLIFLVASIPVNYVRDFYRRWRSAYDPPQADVQTWHRDEPAEARPAAHRAYVSESNAVRPAPARDVSTGSVRQTRSTIQRSDTATPTQPQIWHPPPSAYEEDVTFNPHSGLPTPPIDSQKQRLASPDEWRQYPPFPSAYPATPQQGSSRLPSAEPSIAAPKPVRPRTQFSGIAEEDAEEAQNLGVRQGFRKSLQLPREPRNPGSDGDSSDENQMKGVQIQITQTDDQKYNSENEMDVDEDTYTHGADDDSDMEDDDVFNTTLATPYTRQRYREYSDDDEYLDDLMLTPPPMRTTFSIDSVASGLSTTDAGSSLRTRASSIASTDASSLLDVAPVAGRKRRAPPRYAEDAVKFTLDVPPRKAVAAGRKAAAGGKATASGTASRASTIGRQRGKALQQDTPAASVLDSGEEGEEKQQGDDDEGAASDAEDTKRQRVPGGRVARPQPKRSETQGTVRATAAKTRGAGAAKAGARPAAVRAPSTRAAAAKKERPVLLAAKKSSATSVESEKAAGVGAKGAKPRAKRNETQ